MNRILHALTTLRTGMWQCDTCGGWFGYTCAACQAGTR